MPESRLRWFQLVSPALPVGAFSYSEGLEVLVQHGLLPDASAVMDWLSCELERGTLSLEAACLPLLMADLRRWSGGGATRDDARRAVLERDGWLLAQREAAEVRAQQRQMGASLVGLLADLGWPLPEGDGPAALAWPAAWAWAGVCLELEPVELIEGYLVSWTSAQLSAAVRLVPLGPTQAQRLQLQLTPLLARRAEQLSRCQPEELCSAGVGAGLAQLRHAELYSRLFRS